LAESRWRWALVSRLWPQVKRPLPPLVFQRQRVRPMLAPRMDLQIRRGSLHSRRHQLTGCCHPTRRRLAVERHERTAKAPRNAGSSGRPSSQAANPLEPAPRPSRAPQFPQTNVPLTPDAPQFEHSIPACVTLSFGPRNLDTSKAGCHGLARFVLLRRILDSQVSWHSRPALSRTWTAIRRGQHVLRSVRYRTPGQRDVLPILRLSPAGCGR